MVEIISNVNLDIQLNFMDDDKIQYPLCKIQAKRKTDKIGYFSLQFMGLLPSFL